MRSSYKARRGPIANRPTHRVVETVSVGTRTLGSINQTTNGFEMFDADGVYLATETTLPAARRFLYSRSMGAKAS